MEYCLVIDGNEIKRDFVIMLQESVDIKGGVLRIYTNPNEIGIEKTPCLFAPEGIFRSVNSINHFSVYLRNKETECGHTRTT